MKYYNTKIKPLIRPFLLIFIVSVLIVNADKIFYAMNTKEMDQSVKNLLGTSEISKEIKRAELELLGEYSSEEKKTTEEIYQSYSLENSFIEIPKIGVNSNIVYQMTDDEKEVEIALEGNVMHFLGSAFPGERGDVYLLAHSAPMTWGPDFRIFNNIDELEMGDRIKIRFNNKTYRYKVIRHFMISPGGQVSSNNESEYNLHLFTCWPPGSSANRMVVEAVLE